MPITDEESFNNFMDYKDVIEKEIRHVHPYIEPEALENSIIRMLYERGLINHKLYSSHIDTIEDVYGARKNPYNDYTYIIVSCIMLLLILLYLDTIP